MRERITFDTKLSELIQLMPQSKEVLLRYGYRIIEEEDIESVVLDKLTLKGFCRLMDLDDEAQGNLWQEIQDLYRQVED
ncbi:MAG: DUF1858 domain-containing protein [Aquificaceae bacterium]|nr:DUF1858 domain-containing protein [Aquificaceae bacterium]MCS7196476.1 DUF1858 domain-containing protein [Aquificaceae bacterium]MCX7989509.1 DUF1858 domain-containing protein [Aquificaceae bacterium]MDW8032637.1 DUF1858 domain-containing protein [Aquificaceae bacterium]MDW8294481.1 DUF1858 domain-containing protein [Aquificaceae bacterium]